MSRPIDITLQGVLGTHPTLSRTASGTSFCHFRVASSYRYRTQGDWRESETSWFTAKAWGQMAQNLSRSLRKGDPVIITGRLSQESWTPQGSDRAQITSVITISGAGHDLSRGESSFARVSASRPSPEGGPKELSAQAPVPSEPLAPLAQDPQPGAEFASDDPWMTPPIEAATTPPEGDDLPPAALTGADGEAGQGSELEGSVSDTAALLGQDSVPGEDAEESVSQQDPYLVLT